MNRNTRRIPLFSLSHVPWVLLGLLLIGIHILVALVSARFSYDTPLLQRPILLLVIIEIIAGLLYLGAVLLIKRSFTVKNIIIWALIVGAVLRVVMLTSSPILEDDFYRYLWDGATIANGINPYKYAPVDIAEDRPETTTVPPTLRHLAYASGTVIERINHPHVRTIYPLVAQATFALSYWLGPWNIIAWRIILLLFDIATLVLLGALLKTLNLSFIWLIVYWWNPLVIKEIFNSGHLDVIALPFVLTALLLVIKKRFFWASGTLALAVGVKIWPVMLVPLVLRPLLKQPKKLVLAAVVFVLLAGAMFLPAYAAGFNKSSGFVVYGQYWENNDALFKIIFWGSEGFLTIFGVHSGHAQSVARIIVGALLVLWVVFMSSRRIKNGPDLFEHALLIVAAVFLLSPTGFPWYYVWIVPFLVIRFRVSLALLTALLPLYYLQYYFRARGSTNIFDYGIVWIEFIPIWILLVWEWLKSKQHQANLQPEKAH